MTPVFEYDREHFFLIAALKMIHCKLHAHQAGADASALLGGVGRNGVDLQVGTLTSFYGKGQQLSEAVEKLDIMVHQGSYVDRSIFYGTLKMCIAQKNLVLGSRVHALSVKYGYESNSFLANHFICMYSSLGRLKDARHVFSKVAEPDRYMWASIILAHARHGQPLEAMRLYRQMRESNMNADNYIFAAVIKACAIAQDLSFGRDVHADILRTAKKPDTFVCSSLVDMYAKCGSLEDARKVFDSSPARDVVTWNAMIAGYAQHGCGQEALMLYPVMEKEGIAPSRITYVCLLQACTSLGALHEGKRLHAQIQARGLEADVIVGTCLVDMYSKCGCVEDARRVFDCLPTKDVVTWTAMIAGYGQHGHCHEALALYRNMQKEGIIPADDVTYACLLQACASVGAVSEGRQLHVQIQERGLGACVLVGSSLVNMYAKCGHLEDARKVFDHLPTKDIVTWNSMLSGYAQHGLGQEALTLYGKMQEEGITPADTVTFICLLQACASAGALRQGKQLHSQLRESGLEADVVVGNCLVTMYAKCGSLDDARRVFDKLPARNVVTWTAMIAAYAHHGYGQEALGLYEIMQQEGVTVADAVTFVALLQACGSVAGLQSGKCIHATLSKLGLDCADLFVATALIDMYGRCGSMVDAQQVFDALPVRDTVTWNALIAGYARIGETQLVFDTFLKMRQDGVQPNGIAFLSVLNVCSHVGLVDEGQKYFDTMVTDPSITPTIEHYTCMIDILGRAGQLAKAMEMVKTMPFQPDSVVWSSLLGACRKWKNVRLGKEAFEYAIRLDKHDDAAYVLMANIYSAAQMRVEANEIHATRVKARAWKTPGQSWWTDSNGTVHTFLVGDTVHADAQLIYAKVGELLVNMKTHGYVPNFDSVLLDIPDAEKEAALWRHSEKLAIAHALLKTPTGATLRVVKNLRVCEDCHTAIAYISKIEQRTIICRDASRFHVYKDGKCSCGDYW